MAKKKTKRKSKGTEWLCSVPGGFAAFVEAGDEDDAKAAYLDKMGIIETSDPVRVREATDEDREEMEPFTDAFGIVRRHVLNEKTVRDSKPAKAERVSGGKRGKRLAKK